jgi:AcrR family transcriptional regulator
VTLNRLKDVALSHFTKNGYEGASLADIASDVGIKKQSIYTHFKGKDELFFAVFTDALNQELNFFISYLDNHKELAIDKLLYSFLLEYKERYEHDDTTKFFIRMTYFPPAHLYAKVLADCYGYLDTLEAQLVQVFEKAISEACISAAVSSDRAASAFMAVLDGMLVEMLYGGNERSLKRIDASWFIYWRGIQT